MQACLRYWQDLNEYHELSESNAYILKLLEGTVDCKTELTLGGFDDPRTQ